MQKIGRTIYSVHYTRIAIVFMESKHVLPKEILENSDFVGLNSAVPANKKEEVYAISLHFCKSNTQIRREKQWSLYYKVDLIVLWFINIVGC